MPNRDRQSGAGDPVLSRYERIAFDKELIASPASRWRPAWQGHGALR